MNIAGHLLPARVIFNDYSLKPPLEQMPHPPVPPVEPLAIADAKPLHRPAQVGLGCFQQQVKMIVHQHIGMHEHAEALRQRPQQRQKVAPIRLRPEDRLPFVAARRHMIAPPGRSTRNARAIPSILRASATMSNPIVDC